MTAIPSRKLRILALDPYGLGEVYSGPAVLLTRLFTPIAREHVVDVVTNLRGPGQRTDACFTSTVNVLHSRSLGVRHQLAWAMRASIWVMRKGGTYDIVHIQGSFLFNLLPALAVMVRNGRYVLLPLAADGDLAATARSDRLPGVHRLRRFIVSRASVGFALADRIGEELIALGLSPNRVVPIANPAGTEFRCRGSDKRASLRTIGFAGVVGERKGPDVVLSALAILRARGYPNATALFVGPFVDDAFQREFEEDVKSLGLADAVHVTGYVRDVERYLSNELGVFVLPSQHEGMPGALAEAMVSGLPCYVTDVGSMAKAVHAASCGVVGERNPAPIADFVHRVWSEPAMWERLSVAARTYAINRFSAGAVSRTYLNALAGCLGLPVEGGSTEHPGPSGT